MAIIVERIKNIKPYKVQTIAEGEIKLDAMENPYPLALDIQEKIDTILKTTYLNRYPDPEYKKLKTLIADYCKLTSENILLGNGSDELIMTMLAACGGENRTVCCPVPTFSMYKILAEITNTNFVSVALDNEFKLPVEKIISLDSDINIITYPNNPTGNCFSKEKIEKIINESRGLVVIDEAYFEFSDKTYIKYIEKHKNLIVLRTFSKAFALAGIRAGYMAADKELVKELRKVQMPYNLSILNQKILEVVMQDRKKMLVSVEKLLNSRERMFAELENINGIIPYHSDANFILIEIENMDGMYKALKENKINVRKFGEQELRNYLRVTVGTEEENKSFIETIKSGLKQ